jgi:CRISPR/Cas system-associated exonuclease Cas4 (RecB family)
MKTFSKWTIAEVEDRFGLILTKESCLLTEWFRVENCLSEEEEKRLNELCRSLQDHVHDWNEAELKLKFIAPLLLTVNFDQEKYCSFMEREISVTIENETLSGVIDFIVARGRRIPKKSYFFLHEYKKEQDSSNDPLGQLTVAMVAVQKLNNDNKPLYGAYIMGRLWFFVVLHGYEYSVSLGHNAARLNELNEIFNILKNTKTIIAELMKDEEN